MKQTIEQSIQNSFVVTAKTSSVNEETFVPMIKGSIDFAIPIEAIQDSKVVMTELEMYTLVGKTILEKIAGFGK